MWGFVISAVASLIGGVLAGMSAKNRQEQAIDNQWDMFNAQTSHQDEVNQQAMSFQREMNQANRDWNTESNVRGRIEAAGYNPYLYQNGAMAANTSSSIPLAQNVSPVSPVELSDPFGEFSNSALNVARGVADILRTKQDIKKTAVDTALQDYSLNRQKVKDSYVIGGQTLPKTEALQAFYEVEKAANVAVQEQVNAKLATLRDSLFSAPAVDENDQPVTDETGRRLTMYEASGRAELKSNMKQLDKLLNDISNVKSQIDLNKIKAKLDKYNLKFLQPAQVAKIYASINEIGAIIKEKHAYTGLIGQQTKTEKNKTLHESIETRLRGKDYQNYDIDKHYNRAGKVLSPIVNAVGMAVRH